MTDVARSGIEDLIARLERATGPDRRLDVEIARLTGDKWERAIGQDFEVANGEVSWPCLGLRGKPSRAFHDLALIARYTASIDAALWLGVPNLPEIRVLAATPALALCIAALKCRAASGTEAQPPTPQNRAASTNATTSANSQSGGNFGMGES